MGKSKIKQKQEGSTSKWSSNFDIVSEDPCMKYFQWRIFNFRYVDQQIVLTEKFHMGGPFYFHFQLFPQGEASRNTSGKYLGLYLEIEENNLNADRPTCFVSSEFVIVNHVDSSLSRRKCVSHRCAFGSKSIGDSELLRLDFLLDPQSGFLFKGTDLLINLDIRILDDNWRLEDLPSDKFASTSTEARTDGGKFIWNIHNYRLFAERFKDDGSLISNPFVMGDAQYSMRLHVEKEHFDGVIKEDLIMSLIHEVSDGKDINCFALKEIEVWNHKTEKYDTLGKSYGRLGFETMWGISYFYGTLRLIEITKFEDVYISANGKLEVMLSFFCLNEKDHSAIDSADGEAIWKLGATVASTSAKRKSIGLKYYHTYKWKILKLSKMVEAIGRYPSIEPLKILSRHINFAKYQTRCAFFPQGTPEYSDNVVLGIEGLNSVDIYQEMDILVQFRLGIVNQFNSDRSVFWVQLVRLDRNFNRSFPFVLLSTFYSESGGYFVDGRVELVVDIREVEENLREEELPKGRSNHQRKLITWEVDNFLQWQGIRSGELKYVCSKYFEVQGCRVKLAVAVYSTDLTASLDPDPILELDSNFVTIKYRFAVSKKQISHGNLQWVDGLRNKTSRTPVTLKNLDFTWDKIVIHCEINECLKVVLNDESLNPVVMQGTSSRSVDRQY